MNDLAIPVADAEVAETVQVVATPEHPPYQARTRWIENVKFLGETGSGHTLVMDGPGGQNLGVRPMELFLLGLGGCTSVDVIWFLRGMQEKVTGCDIQIEGERSQTPPHVFTKIHIRYIVTGRDLAPVKVKLAIKMSRDKFCSASFMLGKTAEITHELEIIEAE